MAPPPPPPKRRPTVLVTDARDTKPSAPTRPSARRQFTDPIGSTHRGSLLNPNGRAPSIARAPTSSRVRFVSVDQVLRNTSEIPSGQTRNNPLASIHRGRGPPSSSTATGRNVGPINPRRIVDQSRVLPIRSSKVSEKLVFLPETGPDQGPRWDYVDDEEEGPLRDDEEDNLPTEDESQPPNRLPPRKSYAERLPKARRAEKFSRVTAYCTADTYRLGATSKFLRESHAARTKLYDECLYVAYHLPLLPGGDGFRIKSSPALKSPGGKPVLDVEIERSEAQNYHEGYFTEYPEEVRAYGHHIQHGGGGEGGEEGKSPDEHHQHSETDHLMSSGTEEERRNSADSSNDNPSNNINITPPFSPTSEDSSLHRLDSPKDSTGRMDMNNVGEAYIFSYGVVVFWNLTERQEKDILGDLTFAADKGVKLISGPLLEEDFESEEFHFEYSSKTRSPRIYNDMITLRSGDIMIKLAISHAIAQSTKLCRFEERMSRTMSGVEHIPKKLALTGTLGMSRSDVIKMSGRLFRLRVDVNLSSNVLDVPEFFWDEPALHPLYSAVREYLEIQPRVGVLNSRCGVFLDLAEILTDSIADSNMSRITWIIIVLIVLSIFVTVAEVTIRFALLSKKGGEGGKIGGVMDF